MIDELAGIAVAALDAAVAAGHVDHGARVLRSLADAATQRAV